MSSLKINKSQKPIFNNKKQFCDLLNQSNLRLRTRKSKKKYLFIRLIKIV